MDTESLSAIVRSWMFGEAEQQQGSGHLTSCQSVSPASLASPTAPELKRMPSSLLHPIPSFVP